MFRSHRFYAEIKPKLAECTPGLSLLKQRKQVLREELGSNGMYRPWVFLITDGAPSDSWKSVIDVIAEGEKTKSFSFFCVGTGDADMNVLAQLNPARAPLKLNDTKWREMFTWLSASLKSVSASAPQTKVSIQTPAGWAVID